MKLLGSPMRKNNLSKISDEVSDVRKEEHAQTDQQYLKLLSKLELIIAKIKNKRDRDSVV